MSELVAFLGQMNQGKSALALQMHHSLGGDGLLFTKKDRGGHGVITSRVGLKAPAGEVSPSIDLYDYVSWLHRAFRRIPYIICDEVQFYSEKQVNHMADLVDGLGVDAYAFGLRTDFQGRLFEGSRRLLELADRVEGLPVKTLCWCGRRASHTARVKDGVMVFLGDQVEIGDLEYRSLCRAHHRAGLA
ncbi:thymidine kinase [Streptomyces sp. NPDC001407]|uniref:thymidine kinase n=1 Tax=Streptomyces sp. NPDC001407 TaxID=3364573 RepID=UPI0036C87E10